MTVLITLTSLSLDIGPFNLYSNLDGFSVPFETNISKATLIAGYLSTLVPDYTGIIKVKSTGVCKNSVDIVISTTTTTSTSTSTTSTTTSTTTLAPAIPCSETTSSGGVGVTEYSVNLDSTGGIIVFEFNAQGVVDKCEILHNNVRKATSGMSVPNEGPFDTLYGDPTVPTVSQANAVNQFIGSTKGAIPNRQATFTSETGSSLTIESGYQQLIWFVYTAGDYLVNPNALVRITGPSGTAWNLKRLCEPTTTTTTAANTSTT